MSDPLKRRPTQKKIRGRLLEWMGICYERALHQSLEALFGQVDTWRSGQLSAFELDDKIHLFHNGPSKNLYNYYQVSSDMRIYRLAEAVGEGLVDISELREGICEKVEDIIEAWRSFGN